MNHEDSTKFPAHFAHVCTVSVGAMKRGRWLLSMGDLTGWCGQGVWGICVALEIDGAPYDEDWLSCTALWLASLRNQLDDALWLDDDQLYLVRRYDHDVDAAGLSVGIEQQGVIVRWLSAHHASARGRMSRRTQR